MSVTLPGGGTVGAPEVTAEVAATAAPVTARNHAWDGLRGVAVAGVLAYHLGWSALPGGFLGVSAFFTLSGFLITSLLLAELQRSATIARGAFWARRVRRLLPAAIAAVLLAMAFGRWAADANQLAALKGDAVASLADVANWRFLATHVTYGGVNPFPSPLLHMWSLSIEEQCYLLLPLALLAGWALGRRRGVTIVVVALTACSLAAAWWFANDPMRVYYGTDVRAAEVLIGALGALAVTTRMAPHLRRACAALAPAAILLIGWSWTVASETSPALAHGGLALHAVATLIVILALSQPGWLTGAFAVAPLVWLGRISYGVYLYHWPLFLWLTPARTGLSDGWNDVLRVGASLALATLSFYVLELPIQRMRIAPRPTLAVGAMAIAATMIVAAFVMPAPDRGQLIDITGGLRAPHPAAAAAAGVDAPPLAAIEPSPATTATTDTRSQGAPAAAAAPVPTLIPTVARAADDPLRYVSPAVAAVPPPLPAGRAPTILVVGDSEGASLGNGLQRWGDRTGQAQVWVNGWIGCGIARGGRSRWIEGIQDPPSVCAEWGEVRPAELAKVRPDLVVVLSGMWDIADRELPGRDHWTDITQPDMRTYVTSEYAAFQQMYVEGGTAVCWLLYPDMKPSWRHHPDAHPVEASAPRLAAINDITRATAAGQPRTSVLDLPAVMQARYGTTFDGDHRPDGMHWSDAGSDAYAAWLGPALVEIAEASR